MNFFVGIRQSCGKDIYFSTLQKIANGVGLKLVLVPDIDIAGEIQKGELFK